MSASGGKHQKKNYSAQARAMMESGKPTGAARPHSIKEEIPPWARSLIETILFVLVAVFFLRTFIFEAYRIPTGSMESTLKVGDMLLVNKFIYGAKSPMTIPFTDVRIPYFTLPAMRAPRRGDVVVFIYPGDRDVLQAPTDVNYIKRCVGTPGDTVEVRNKILYVNGQKFFTPPGMQFERPVPMPKGDVMPEMFPRGAPWNPDNYGPLRVPKKGDVVHLSPDNFFAWQVFIEREGHDAALRNNAVYIDGKPASTYTVERNYYFMMGDNRDNSEDSRFWGFVPDNDIVGEAMFIYWSWDPSIPLSNFTQLIGSTRWNRIAQIVR